MLAAASAGVAAASLTHVVAGAVVAATLRRQRGSSCASEVPIAAALKNKSGDGIDVASVPER